MLDFSSADEEESTLDLFNLTLHAKQLDLPASEETFNRILKAVRLDGLKPWVFEGNPSLNAPYHGGMHEMLMTCYAFMAAAYHDVGWCNMRALVLAASLHDYDHTGALAAPTTDDSVNIERAIIGLHEFAKQNGKVTAAELALAERLIRCTRYPYLADTADLLEEIMRDADLCMPYVASPVREQLFSGLRAELAASGRVYSAEEFADGVHAFYGAAKYHTAWSQVYAEAHNLKSKLDELSSNMRTA